MNPARYRRFAPLIVLFAWLQALAPAVAAIADARLLDDRTPYAHVESETNNGCAVVHEHDCALCAVATSATGVGSQDAPLPPRAVRGAACVVSEVPVVAAGAFRGASQRAPPAERG